MRLRTGLCGLLLAILAGCETLPETLRIEIDERIIEVKRKPLALPPPAPDAGPIAAPALDSAAPVQPDAQPER